MEQVEINGLTRSSFILRGAVAAGSVYGAGMVGPFVRQAIAQSDMGDVDILNFALTLEYLEQDFYAEAVAGGKLTGETKRFAGVVANHEHSHVAFLHPPGLP